jgi:alcohol dehydrogenase class IV
MKGFTFQTTRQIVSEPGSSAQIGAIIKGLGATRVLIVTDAGIVKAKLIDAALASLDAAGIAHEIYTDVVADPPEAMVLAAVDAGRRMKADGVLGFGGGSSMDTAKLVAFLLKSEQKLGEIYGIGFCKGWRLPLVLVPTTAGTGSEVTPIAIVTTGASEKKGVVSTPLLPDVAVLDADLTLGLPRHVTAATGIDAMVHAIEAYTSRHKKNPMSDTLAREALRLLAGNIRAACFDGGNRQARANMLLGAMLAGMAFTNAPVAAVHALAYPIGGHFHVPHGLSNSLVMTHVMRFNAPTAAAMYAELAPIVFPKINGATDTAKAEAMIEGIAALIAEIGLETQLRQVGISHNHVPMLAEDAMKQTRLLVNNPREVAYDDALRIYEAAL